MKNGRRFSRPPDPYTPPATPQGQINITDPASRANCWPQRADPSP